MQAEPRIGLISDHTSPILAGYIQQAGYSVLQVSPDLLIKGDMEEVDAWVVDCADANAIADATLWLEPRVLALSNRPMPDQLLDYRHWCERIITTLEKWTGHIRHAQTGPTTSSPSAYKDVRGVWLLAGSTGAIGAVSAFLSALKPLPSLAFLYAQHIDARQEASLAVIGAANPALQTTLALGRHWLNPDHLLIVPASSQLKFGRQGEVFSTREPWQTQERPSLNALMLSMTGITPALAGIIVFSGAGADGKEGLEALSQMGSRIWVQQPSTCEAPSMPNAAIATGRADLVASPAELATRLQRLYPN